MADEQKLTVAELLARNSKDRASRGETGSGPGSRPRRRRSLDEGGVSVAELTGNLEKVEAAPAESKHSSVPIDQTAPVIPAPKAKEGAEAPSGEEVPTEAPSGDSDSGETESTEATAAKAPATEAEPQPEEAPAVVAEDRDAEVGEAEGGETEGGEAAATAAVRVAPSAATARPVRKFGEASASAQPAQEPVEEPAEQRAPAGPPSTDDTAVISRVPQEEPAEATSLLPAQPGEGPELPATAEPAELAEPEEEEEKLNIFAIIVLVLVGILLGAVVFKGFEILWGRFDRLLVAVLALVMTAVIVGVVHALRTVNDRVSMLLAAFVGLVITFGPLLVVM